MMDEHRLLIAVAEGTISYVFYLLMTMPPSELALTKARAYRTVAIGSQTLARWFGQTGIMFGQVGLTAERKAQECLS